MSKRYLNKQNEAQFKVGDKVRCIRKAHDCENGWVNGWVEEMDAAVGKIGVITAPRPHSDHFSAAGIPVQFEGVERKTRNGMRTSSYYYPYFVLEKVQEENENGLPCFVPND